MKMNKIVCALLCANASFVLADDELPFISVETERLNPVPQIMNPRGTFPEPAGIAMFDYDNDGDLDLFVSNSEDNPCYLYQNDGNGYFTDVAEQAGVQFIESNVDAIGVGDFDNDGRLDLLLGRQDGKPGVSAKPVFLHNLGADENGVVRFADKSEEVGFNNLPDSVKATGFAVADIDLDGQLDIYISSDNLSHIGEFFGITGTDDPNVLVHNQADCRTCLPKFVDITFSAGVPGSRRNGLTPETADISWYNHTWVAYPSDVNHDGYPDFFALNGSGGPLVLYLNNGDLTFTRSDQKVLDKDGAYMGIASTDYDGDGYLDYFVTNFGGRWPDLVASGAYPVPALGTHIVNEGQSTFNVFLKGSQDGTLTDVSPTTLVEPGPVLVPLNYGEFPGFQPYGFGWGAVFFDADNRGIDDLYYVGIDYQFAPVQGMGRFFRNNGNGSFSEKTFERNLFNFPQGAPLEYGYSNNGNGLLSGDLDNDGDEDIVVINTVGPGANPGAEAGVRIFLNPGNNDNSYVDVSLKGRESNIDGVGALVEVFTFDDDDDDGHRVRKKQIKEMGIATSFMSAKQPVLHFGLGENERPFRIKVTWPSGEITERIFPAGHKSVVLDEGDRRHTNSERKHKHHHHDHNREKGRKRS